MPVYSNNNTNITPFPQVDKTLHGLRIRNATVADIPQLVALHMQHFDPSEFSILLGQQVVQQFYDYAVSSPCASLLVAVEGEKVFGFSLGIQCYSVFLTAYKRRVLGVCLKRLFALTLSRSWRELSAICRNIIIADTYVPSKPAFEFHLGVILLDSELGKSAPHILAFSELFKTNIKLVKDKSGGPCWTTVAKHNKKSIRIVKSMLRPDEQHTLRNIPVPTWCFICN